MTPRQIGALIVAAALVLACALIRLAPRLLGTLAHRGEADDAPDPIDRAYAQTCVAPLEYVPPLPHPDLHEREREMAGTPAALAADLLDHRSKR